MTKRWEIRTSVKQEEWRVAAHSWLQYDVRRLVCCLWNREQNDGLSEGVVDLNAMDLDVIPGSESIET